ncbi:Protein of unknown function [Streptococcus thermophilus]|nr:Protein of unknown function [Streptococcus thermophilus]
MIVFKKDKVKIGEQGL